MFPSVFLLTACLQGSTGPEISVIPEITLRVTGGLAGVDYSFLVDGPRREVVGESCVSGCDFQEGELLHGLTTEQAYYLGALFREAGIHQLAGTDFGYDCCDQFHYELTYKDPDGESSVQGSSELIPESLREAISAAVDFAEGSVPIVVAMDQDPDHWPMDPTILEEWTVSGNLVHFRLSYPGGCRTHHFNLVAFGGFKESDPVRVSVLISHDANGDECEALLRDDLTFGLLPLKAAYEAAYGVSDPGTTTLLMEFEGAVSFSSQSPPVQEYVF